MLLNGVEIPSDDLWIWQMYNCKCTAHPDRWAVALHEEPPRSLNPDWRDSPELRFPVCNECHEKLHHMSRHDAAVYLDTNRKRFYPNAERKILEHD